MRLVADAPQVFNRLVVCAIAQPGAGTLTVQLGDVQQQMDLGSPTERPECRTFRSDSLQATASVTQPTKAGLLVA